jgi:TonB-dependent receptor
LGKFMKKSKISLALLTALTVNMTSYAYAEENNKIKKQKKDEVEVIEVTGIRGSIKQSMNDKRFSSEIMDSISAEDIGQLPDNNIAEALQRITGVQMSRNSDGEGESIQIRGISDNNVEINGQSASGSSGDRNINFQDLPSELFSGIEVLKTPTASRIEGSLGGSINLKTRRPLNIQKDQVATITAKAKYAELPDEVTPDANMFLAKNFRNTDYGDFGFIVNGGVTNINSHTDAYGAADYDGATGGWLHKTGVTVPAGGTKNNPFNKPGPFEYAKNIDVNGDGIADENDVFYMPALFRSFSRTKESTRKSINTSFQWQPYDELNIYVDYTYNESDQDESGSQVNAQINAGRSYILADSNPSFSPIGNGNYVLDKGLIGGANVRLGGSPSWKNIKRDSHVLTIGADYQITDDLHLAVVANGGEGTGTVLQSNLSMAYDYTGKGKIDANDNIGIIDFNYADSLVPYMTFYDSPFYNGGPTSIDELNAVDITDLSHPNLKYFTMQRNADDSNNENSSFQFDLTYDLNGDFFTEIKVGGRYSNKEFHRVAYQNQSQKNDKVVDGKTEAVDMRDIYVNPDINTSEEDMQVATDLQQCLTTRNIELDQGGNMPNSWPTTDCDIHDFTDYFNMHDIRAYSEARGAGYYERPENTYTVAEETTAFYVQTDFLTELAGLGFYGNLGVRYIDTTTSSAGIVDANPGVKPISYENVTFGGDYQEVLPSMNLNLALNDEMIVRFAAYKAIQRPGLGQLSPGVKLSVNDNTPPYDGTATMGNPELDPVKATNFDLSYEWYYSDSSMISAAVFYKDLDSLIAINPVAEPIEISGGVYLAKQPDNFPGTKIKGYELNIQHGFDHLEGLLSHTGVGANYTYTTEDSDLMDAEGDEVTRPNLSEKSYNLSAYYDDNKLSFRFAYSWRDDFVRRATTSLGWGSPISLPEMTKARGQLDFSANYQLTPDMKINFSAINLTDSTTERYLKYKELTNFVSNSGRRYNLGLVYRF